MIGGTVCATVCLVAGLTARAGSGPAPGNSDAFGRSLGQWMLAYTTWYLGSADIPPDGNGNADVGRVVLLPLPNAPGDGTPASIDVTLGTGQPFTLPFTQWIGNSYIDGSEDPVADVSDFRDMQITVKLDGQPIITSKNVMDYYTEEEFDPPLTTDLPAGIGATAWVFVQSIGIAHPPLTPGQHTLTLDESISFDDLGFTEPVVYHNTWNITVKAGR